MPQGKTIRISKKQQLVSQLQFFLEASDEVDLTEEAAEELLLCLPREDDDGDDDHDHDDAGHAVKGNEEKKKKEEEEMEVLNEENSVEVLESANGELNIFSLFRAGTPGSFGQILHLVVVIRNRKY